MPRAQQAVSSLSPFLRGCATPVDCSCPAQQQSSSSLVQREANLIGIKPQQLQTLERVFLVTEDGVCVLVELAEKLFVVLEAFGNYP